MSPYRSGILSKTLTMILAGGQGERLLPLTVHRSKPSVNFGGIYRIIDFTLSNCLNSGLRRIYVLTQYKSLTLDQHIKHGWDLFNVETDEFIYSLPPQHYAAEGWYQGTADAIFQNVYLFNLHRPERVLVLKGDHVYKMDYQPLIRRHVDCCADVTIAAVERSLSEARQYGVLGVDETGRLISFQDRPEDPTPLPGKPDKALCSMGIYVFQTDALVRAVMADAKNENSIHEFAHDILPKMLEEGRSIHTYLFEDTAGSAYWRDIGTLDSYYEASMDLIEVTPSLNLYDQSWPIRCRPKQLPPAKTVFSQEGHGGRLGSALDSLISPGCIVSGGKVNRSILANNVRINSYSLVQDSILMENVTIGRHSRLRRCIVDEGVAIPEGAQIGYDRHLDEAHFTVTPNGIVVIPKGLY